MWMRELLGQGLGFMYHRKGNMYILKLKDHHCGSAVLLLKCLLVGISQGTQECIEIVGIEGKEQQMDKQ
ncbi:hypothetical protein MHYP_G00057230 [Metynnis hypsauchen]